MTFLEGFAQGFTAERNRRLAEEENEKQLKLKFAFDDISERRKQRDEQRAKDRDIAEKAKLLAERAGAPDAAPQLARELKIRSMDDIVKDIDAGAYTPNKDYQGTTTIKMPQGVAPVKRDLTEGYPEDIANEVKNLAPNLATYEEDATPNYDQIYDPRNSPLVYNKQTEIKLPSLPNIMANLDAARAKGDKAAEAKWTGYLNNSIAANNLTKQKPEGTFTAFIKSDPRAPGTLATISKRVNDNGEEELYNVDTGKVITTGTFKLMNEQQVKTFIDLDNKYRDRVTNVSTRQSALIGTMKSANELNKILSRNPQALSWISDKASDIVSLGKEFDAAKKIFFDPSLRSKDEIQEDLNKVGSDPEYAKQKIQEVKGFIGNLEQSLQTYAKSDVIRRQAIDSALAQAHKSMLIYNLAAAYGQKGNSVGEKDIARFETMIGGKDQESINMALSNAIGTINAGIDAERSAIKQSINNESSIITGFIPKSEFSVARTLGIINGMKDIPEEDRLAIANIYQSSIAGNQQGSREAVQSLNEQTLEVPVPKEKPKEVQGTVIPSRAIDLLLKNPELKEQFDKKYGKGTSDLYLRRK